MTGKSDKTKTAILKALHEIGGPAGATRILARLSEAGLALQPRTVRYYLLLLDREGMTRRVSRRRGRQLTDRGREELAHADVMGKVGFVAAKVDTLGYRMSFDRRRGAGTIVANVALLAKADLALAARETAAVFDAGLGMGERMMLVRPGGRVGDLAVPEGQVGLGTVCSVTVNGILLNEGIPVTSRFGGLLEMRGREPVRFVELIEYAGTTVDPLEAFIKAGMTDVRHAVGSGRGIVGASFREVPSAAVDAVGRLHRDMQRRGLGGILAIGLPNRPLLDIPVAEGRAGIIVVGGLNPVAAVYEAGVAASMLSLAGLHEFSAFLPYREALQHDG